MKKIFLYTVLSLLAMWVAQAACLAHGFTESLPLEFVPNHGQWDERIVYKVQSPEGEIYLEKDGITYVTGAPDNSAKIHAFKHNEIQERPILSFHAYKVSFVGAQIPQSISGSKPQPHYYNYYYGQNPDQWVSKIYPYRNVSYTQLYPGIDLHFSSQSRNLKYDFIVQPGADPELIKMQFSGQNKLRIHKKNLEIITTTGTVTELKPYAYQFIDQEKVEVPCYYHLKNDVVSYVFPEGYNTSVPLIIDPTVIFARYTGSSFDNWGFTATYDDMGNFYAGGIVSNMQGGSGYIVTPGAFQLTFAGGDTCGSNINPGTGAPLMPCDIAISKYDATGNTLLYATYIGGSSNEQPHSMVVDHAGNWIISGRTCSADFPVTPGAYSTSNSGRSDIIITKFDPTGLLVASTYVGGSADDGVNISSRYSDIFSLKHNYGDDARSEVIVDNANNIYLASCTRSMDFPVTPNAAQSTLQGGQDGVVMKFNINLSTLIWSTYLGGMADDAAYVLALNTTQSHLYVGGGTASPNFLSIVSGGLNPGYLGGTADGYIVKFQNSGTYAPIVKTFLGNNDYDQCYGVQVDRNNNVYAMGQTVGGGFPVTPGVYSNPGSSQFVIKLDSSISTNVYSTVFGSGMSTNCNISPVAFLVDTCEQVYISGWGGPLSGNGGNTNGMPITSDAAQPTTDGSDFYFIVLSKDAAGLLYATYMGSPVLGEHVDGGTSRFDANGIVYQAICGGCGGSSTFPITTGPPNGSTNCNLVALKIAFELAPVVAQASASPNTRGCAPFEVNFLNSSTSASDYLWDFGDGNTSTVMNPTYTYTDPGVYTVKLIANNNNSCLVTSDTTILTIVVDTGRIKSDFEYNIISSCDPFTVSFTNTSELNTFPPAAANTVFIWDFGDGTSFVGSDPPVHQYPDTGTYVVTLVMIDTFACNNPDTMQKTVQLSMFLVIAGFDLPDTICIGDAVSFINLSENALTYLWGLDNGSISHDVIPAHAFSTPGTFEISLVAGNVNSCNKFDSATRWITVLPQPEASFYYDPTIPVTNEPITYTNTSKNATSYLWSFGDGNTSTEIHPVYMHKKSGKYTVCLIAWNELGCSDTACRRIDADIVPAIGVPNAFSPNGDGNNDILYVRGAAIVSLQFRVYNRWGELVFETTDLNVGWDGTYKGKPQEMDSYAYTLQATFEDGTSTSKQGNVTLLR